MKPKPIIAVDLDDVLAANAEGFVKFSNERWGTHLRTEDFHENLSVLWGVDIKTVNKRMIDFCESEIVRNYGYFKEALPVLHHLKEKYILLLITSRRKRLVKATADWVAEYLPNIFDSIHHTGFFDQLEKGAYNLTKGDILQNLGAEYLIDDQLKHCAAAGKIGLKALLLGNYKWNEAAVLSRGVTRVGDWRAVGDYFHVKD